MAIELAGYRGWHGTRRSPWLASWPIMRTGFWLVLRRKIFWPLFALGLLNFLFHFAIIYLKAQLVAQKLPFSNFLDRFVVTGNGEAYLHFMFAQGVATMITLAFAGTVLIGSDYQQLGLTFYLSRVRKIDYIAGKVLAVAGIVSLVTVAPALVLYAAYGMFSSSFDYFRENPRILLGIVGYGAVMAFTLGLVLAAVGAWVPRTVPLVITWVGIFLLLPALGESMRHIRDDRIWRLLNLRYDLYLLGGQFFGALDERRGEPELARWAAWVVPGVCLLCLFMVIRRVRAVEVVK